MFFKHPLFSSSSLTLAYHGDPQLLHKLHFLPPLSHFETSVKFLPLPVPQWLQVKHIPQNQASRYSKNAGYWGSSHQAFLFSKEFPSKQGCLLFRAALPIVGAASLELAQCCKEGSKGIQRLWEKVSKYCSPCVVAFFKNHCRNGK